MGACAKNISYRLACGTVRRLPGSLLSGKWKLGLLAHRTKSISDWQGDSWAELAGRQHGSPWKQWEVVATSVPPPNSCWKASCVCSGQQTYSRRRPRTLEHARAKRRTKPKNVVAAGFQTEPITSVSGSTMIAIGGPIGRSQTSNAFSDLQSVWQWLGSFAPNLRSPVAEMERQKPKPWTAEPSQ